MSVNIYPSDFKKDFILFISGVNVRLKDLSGTTERDMAELSGAIKAMETKVSTVADVRFKAEAFGVLSSFQRKITERQIEILDAELETISPEDFDLPSVASPATVSVSSAVSETDTISSVADKTLESSILVKPIFHLMNAYECFKSGQESTALVHLGLLPEEFRERVYEKLASLTALTTLQVQALLVGSDITHQISAFQKCLALRLCITPDVILAGILGMEEMGNIQEAQLCFSYLPPELQKRYNTWVLSVASSRLGHVATIKEATLQDKVKAADGFKAVDREECWDIPGLLDIVESYQMQVDQVAKDMQESFKSFEKTPGITPGALSEKKKNAVHYLADRLCMVVHSVDQQQGFEKSKETELEAIIKDYHKRYPSIARSHLMYQFFPEAAGSLPR